MKVLSVQESACSVPNMEELSTAPRSRFARCFEPTKSLVEEQAERMVGRVEQHADACLRLVRSEAGS